MIWRFRHIDRAAAASLAADLGQPLKMGEFLSARQFREAGPVREFVRADLKSLPPPLSLTDMDKAVERLLTARRRGELTAICGDYDADGLTAAALLARGFKELGLKALVRVPNRLTEGYGLKPEAVAEMAGRGARLIVTVDTGFCALAAVERAGEAGLEVIITDHHRLPPKLPPALALINPHRNEIWRDNPPAGVGVAFMLLAALKRRWLEAGLLGPGDGPALLEYLPLVAIGTIADLAPLQGPNRILVRHGLALLGSTAWPGLAALKKVARLSTERVGGRDVGFRLAPRLNAAGRLGSADPALSLLLADAGDQADSLAAQLDDLNHQRYQGQNRLCREVSERLELEVSPDRRTVVLADPDWPRGLLGLAAARVSETVRKPTVLFRLENGLAVGSGRSYGGFNLYQALEGLRPLFLSFGGHAQAAGLTLASGQVEEFSARLEDAARAEPDFSAEPELEVDLTVSLGDLESLVKPLAALEPYGTGHPPPVLVIPRARVGEARPTNRGGEAHMKMVLVDGLARLTVVGFNLADRLEEVGPEMDVALSLEVSEYQGRLSPAWRLLDFRPPGSASQEGAFNG
ncbi:MAG: single-stranded-DNA-specific exonuclease RecJ [Candidatus Adiutrix sp.]|nr:single-stranded-DNA-specific exonuclease RecJ [Candidatus Adiutrix sp.]